MTKAKRKPSEKAAIEAKKDEAVEKQREIVNTDGVTLILKSVPPAIVQDVQLRIEDPEVPIWYNEVKDRDEPNPVDPSYLAALDRARNERSAAVTDAAIAFGVELPEGTEIPESFFKKLERLHIEIDREDKDEVDFLYKKYTLDTEAIFLLMKVSGIEVGKEAERFRELFRS